MFVLVFYIFNTIRFALWDSVFLYRNFQDNYIKAEKFFSIFTLPDSRVLSEQKQTTHF